MTDIKIYLIILIPFALGFIVGIISSWDLIKRYKKAQGLDPDPLDGKELTPMQKFVKKNRITLKDL